MSDQHSQPLRVKLIALTFSRTLLTTALRMMYPFLPAFARGLGINLAAMGQLVALRNSAGIFAPVFAPLSEKYGRRAILVSTLILLTVACAIILIWPAYWPMGVTLLLIALAKVIFDPAMQAFIGDAVPYARRGKAIAITELSWSGALLFGAPAVGWLIQGSGWQSPFAALAIGSVVALLLLWWALPADRPAESTKMGLRQMRRLLREHPIVWAIIFFVGAIMLANELLFIVYGAWMEKSFGLNLSNLGMAAAVLGGAEILGEITVGVLVDRLGKKRLVLIAGLMASLIYALLPFGGNQLTIALLSLFTVFYFFEITVVASIPLYTEVVPSARAVVMGLVGGASAAGRALGSWLGPLIWGWRGLPANGLASAGITLIAIVVLYYWVNEK